jgi:AraC-like DNA-binding protein
MIARHHSADVARVRVGGMTLELKRFLPLARVERHSHEGAYCCVLLNGTVEERLVHARELRPGDLTIRAPGAAHTLRFGKGLARAVVVEIDAEKYSDLEAGGFVPAPAEIKSSAIASAAVRLAHEFPLRDSASTLILEGLALELLGVAARSWRRLASPEPPAWLKRARERVMDDARGGYTVKDLAKHAGVHPTHLAAAFRTWYDQSPGELMRQRRLDRALELLRTELPLTEVALAAGYYDQSHFTHDVRARTGLTPRALRGAIRS